MGRDEVLTGLPHSRVDDRLQRRELPAIGKDDRREAIPIQRSRTDAARKHLADFLNKRPSSALKCTDHGIGVEHRHAGGFEHLGDRRFAHSNRTGEGDPDHVSSKPRSRRAQSSGISGMPKMVKWSPSMDENSCTPRASKRKTPTV